VAWEALAAGEGTGRAELFPVSLNGSSASAGRPRAARACAKIGTVLRALHRTSAPQAVLAWHLGFLKLVPFLRIGTARLVLFLHGIEAWNRPDWATRRLLARVDLFLANSRHTWRRFVEANPACATRLHRVVPLGIDVPLEGRPPLPDTRPAALMLGRLRRDEDYKGHREVLRAWPSVVRHVPDAVLWIAGDGDLRAELEALARESGAGERVVFWGRVSESSKAELLARSRCLVLPSRGEGFGLVYLEAMRIGRPCLVSGLDGGSEVVSPPEAGLAADPARTDEVADAITRLLHPGPGWERWSVQARRRYETAYTAAHFHARLAEALAQRDSPVPVP
jgi:phosphatidylinositol alpha-1,6-mannosyltransferase